MWYSWLLGHLDDNQLDRLNMNLECHETAALGMPKICQLFYIAAKISLSKVFSSVYYKDYKVRSVIFVHFVVEMYAS